MDAEPKLPAYTTGADLFDQWSKGVTNGTPPEMFPVGKGDMARVELGPGRVLLLGGAPGAGKTALAVQWVFDAVRLTPDLRAVVCNVEMAPCALLDRQLSRLSRVSLTAIRGRTLSVDERAKVQAVLNKLKPLVARVEFVNPPYTLENAGLTAHATGARLLLLDYIQRINSPGTHNKDKRGQLEATMGLVRQVADDGHAVIVVAAVGRSKDSKGRNSYGAETLSLASFRESSELEYGADDAFILAPAPSPADPATLKHLKSRYGETRDILLTFDKPRQRFIPFGSKDEGNP